MKLTKEQQKVVNSTKSNVFVLATAGSGKTTTMIETVKNKIAQDIVQPERVYMTSFTNSDVENTVKKLNEKRIPTGNKKFDNDLSEEIYQDEGVNVSTLHVLAQTVIKRIVADKGLELKEKDNFVLYNHYFAKYIKKYHSKDIEDFFDEGKMKLGLSLQKSFKEQFECTFIRSAITNNKKHYKECEKQLAEAYRVLSEPFRKEFNEFMLKQNKASINLDNTFILVNLLLEKYQDFSTDVFPFDLFIIDESQDLSRMQLDFIKGLKKHFKFQLYMVGDLRQSIYGWRDADPAYYNDWIHTILKEESDSELLSLSETFRLPNEQSCELPNEIFKQSPLYDSNIHFPTKSKRHEEIVLNNYDNAAMFDNQIRKNIAEKYNLFYLEPYEKGDYDNILNLVRKLIYVDHVEPYEICIVANRNATLMDIQSHPYTHGEFAVPIGRDFLDYDIAALKNQLEEIKHYLYLWKLFKGNRKNENTIYHSYQAIFYQLRATVDRLEQNDYVKNHPKNENKIKENFHYIHMRCLKPLKKLTLEQEYTLNDERLESLIGVIDCVKNEKIDAIRKNARPRNQVAVLNACNIKGKEFDYVIYLNDLSPRNIDVTSDIDELDKKTKIDKINKMFVILTRAKRRTYICPQLNNVKKGYKQTIDGKKFNYVNDKEVKRMSDGDLRRTLLASQITVGVLPYKDKFIRCYDDLFKDFHTIRKSKLSLKDCLYSSYIETSEQLVKEPYDVLSEKNFSVSGVSRNILLYPFKSFHPKLLNSFKTKELLELMEDRNISYENSLYEKKSEERKEMILNLENKYPSSILGNRIEERTRQFLFGELDETDSEKDELIDILSQMSAAVLCHFGEESPREERSIDLSEDVKLEKAFVDFLTEEAVIEMKCTRLHSASHILQAIIYGILLNNESTNKVKKIRIIYPLSLIMKTESALLEMEYDLIPDSFIDFIEEKIIDKKDDWLEI